jgi:hypothetical protein
MELQAQQVLGVLMQLAHRVMLELVLVQLVEQPQ